MKDNNTSSKRYITNVTYYGRTFKLPRKVEYDSEEIYSKEGMIMLLLSEFLEEVTGEVEEI